MTQDVAVAGSTFKPFTLAAYLENGGSLKSKYSGKNKLVVGDFTKGVTNYAGENFGDITVLKATADSVNVVYAQMNDEIGPDKTREAAIAAGLPESTSGLDSVSTSNVLGTASPHPHRHGPRLRDVRQRAACAPTRSSCARSRAWTAPRSTPAASPRSVRSPRT